MPTLSTIDQQGKDIFWDVFLSSFFSSFFRWCCLRVKNCTFNISDEQFESTDNYATKKHCCRWQYYVWYGWSCTNRSNPSNNRQFGWRNAVFCTHHKENVVDARNDQHSARHSEWYSQCGVSCSSRFIQFQSINETATATTSKNQRTLRRAIQFDSGFGWVSMNFFWLHFLIFFHALF